NRTPLQLPRRQPGALGQQDVTVVVEPLLKRPALGSDVVRVSTLNRGCGPVGSHAGPRYLAARGGRHGTSAILPWRWADCPDMPGLRHDRHRISCRCIKSIYRADGLDKPQAARELARVLRPAGRLLLRSNFSDHIPPSGWWLEHFPR